jgi:hypothetical protein
MLVIIMLEQCVVGVVGLDAAGSRIRIPSAKGPGAWLGHEPGDTKGQQRSQADSCDLAMTSANALEQQRSRRHAVYGMQGVRGSNPLSSTPGQRPSSASTVPESPASGSKLAAF